MSVITPQNYLLLKDIVEELVGERNIEAVALFGSYARGDFTPESDIDLLVVERDNNISRTERIVKNDVYIDLEYLSRTLLIREDVHLDQKLYEAMLIYDLNGLLTKAIASARNNYRLGIRRETETEYYVTEHILYMSKAKTAHQNQDTNGAVFYMLRSIEEIFKLIPIITFKPLSKAKFMYNIKIATDYMNASHLHQFFKKQFNPHEVSQEEALNKAAKLEDLWRNLTDAIVQLDLSQAKPEQQYKAKYLFDPNFREGCLHRIRGQITRRRITDAVYYIKSMAMQIIEEYYQSKRIAGQSDYSYTVIKDLAGISPSLMDQAISLLDLNEISISISRVVEIARNIRSLKAQMLDS